jgi:hypothetical protein
MEAYIKVHEGRSEIKITDDSGNTVDIYRVKNIHVEINKADIEPLENQGILLPQVFPPAGRVQ